MKGHLKEDEPHPSSKIAFQWIKNQPMVELQRWLESFYSCSISDNRLAEICAETLRRLLSGEPVSDRYILGLYVAMRYDHSDIGKKSRKKVKDEKADSVSDAATP